MKDLQLINWFPTWQGFKIKHTDATKDTNAGYYLIYRWFVLLGFWEIRKFMNKDQRKNALKLHHNRTK